MNIAVFFADEDAAKAKLAEIQNKPGTNVDFVQDNINMLLKYAKTMNSRDKYYNWNAFWLAVRISYQTTQWKHFLKNQQWPLCVNRNLDFEYQDMMDAWKEEISLEREKYANVFSENKIIFALYLNDSEQNKMMKSILTTYLKDHVIVSEKERM